jgi:cytochrome b pre-mRNA-processing protein 3
MLRTHASEGPMLGFLFRGLTAEPKGGAVLFDAATAEARRPAWYAEANVPDTLDGRFAVLATVTALMLVRLEREGDEGNRLSVVLTERFIEVMESEHRELGLGDPTLGKTVRKLVGMLARRTELWRSAKAGEIDWATATGQSLPAGDDQAERLTKQLADRIDAASLADLQKGHIA